MTKLLGPMQQEALLQYYVLRSYGDFLNIPVNGSCYTEADVIKLMVRVQSVQQLPDVVRKSLKLLST